MVPKKGIIDELAVECFEGNGIRIEDWSNVNTCYDSEDGWGDGEDVITPVICNEGSTDCLEEGTDEGTWDGFYLDFWRQ